MLRMSLMESSRLPVFAPRREYRTRPLNQNPLNNLVKYGTFSYLAFTIIIKRNMIFRFLILFYLILAFVGEIYCCIYSWNR